MAKVTFDGINKQMSVINGVTALDIKVDVYSDWKEWFKTTTNSKHEIAMRTIGGDPTLGLETAGDIYFLINGWRILYDPEVVRVTGVIFSDDFETPWLHENTLNELFPVSVASLVTGLSNIPTATTTATAVRTELTTELSRIDTTISSRASQTSLDALIVTVGNMSGVINDLLKYQGNKTLIDPNAFTMTIYEDDGTTPLKVFDLQDGNGVASITDIYRRIPRA